MRSLSQAPHLGGLHRASRLPFKVSSFTSAEHPANATTQRLIAHLIWAMETLIELITISFHHRASWRTPHAA
jgi:hypothetical protein